MGSSLESPKMVEVLKRLFKATDDGDPEILAQIRSHYGDALGTMPARARADAMAAAYIPVSPEGGRLLYILARAQRSRNIVEFGTSFGISTIYLAAAVCDNGAGRVISTELNPDKARQARRNLADAGMLDYVEIREGDALETLAQLENNVDFLFLDGWKDLYLPMLKLLEPRLPAGALIAADDVNLQPEPMKPYLAYVRDPAHGYVSVEFPVADGLEISLHTSAPR
jgi:predicted O-methyltransferase YrrM